MNVALVLEALQETLPAGTLELQPVPIDDTMVELAPDCIHVAAQVLVERLGLRHLSTITGQDTGSEVQLLYHFWDGCGLTLRTSLPRQGARVATLTDLIPGAAFYEREVSEMLDVTFDGHSNPRPLLLPDDWDGGPPLKRPLQSGQPSPPLGGGRQEPMARRIADVRRTSDARMTIPIGPQHPALKEPLSFLLTVEGEQIVESALRIGYVHRGLERIFQNRNYVQNVHVVERVCGICSHVHTTAYCQGVEALLGLQVPLRALYLRTLLCELERIHSHLLWLGVLAEHIGFTTIFMYTWRDREIVLDVMEELSGGRVAHAVNVIGGVRIDLDREHVRSILKRLDELERQIEIFLGVIQHERTFQARTRGVGHLSADQVSWYCVVGPVARASGVDVDLRRDAAYAVYDRLDFQVITAGEGDVWARTMVRTLETIESLHMCRQLLKGLPGGPLTVRAPRRVPSGEVVSRCEAPRGELVYYVRSDGSERPARVKVRTPTLTSLITLPDQLRGVNTADVPTVLAGVDLCIACADR